MEPIQPNGITIILLFWGVTASLFIGFNRLLITRPVFRNVPEGADVPIDMLPGGDDPFVVVVGEEPPDGWWEATYDYEAAPGSQPVDAEVA